MRDNASTELNPTLITHSLTLILFLKANGVRRNWVSDHTWYLDHPRQTNRDESKIETIEAYLRASGMKRCYSNGEDPEFTQVVELDLCSVVASCSGPKRPHDRVPISTMKADFANCLTSPIGFKASVLTIAQLTDSFQFSHEAGLKPKLCLLRKMQLNQLWSRLILKLYTVFSESLGHKENVELVCSVVSGHDMNIDFWVCCKQSYSIHQTCHRSRRRGWREDGSWGSHTHCRRRRRMDHSSNSSMLEQGWLTTATAGVTVLKRDLSRVLCSVNFC